MYRVDLADNFTVYCGDALDVLKTLPSGSVNCCVTSPPYYGLRDYGVEGQLGLENTPDHYVENLVNVFREVRRVLRDDGTLWVNIGDSYAGSWGNYGGQNRGKGSQRTITVGSIQPDWEHKQRSTTRPGTSYLTGDLKAKDLIGIPWMLAFALRADGWYLRSEIIWHKPNPMPESVKDRPTKAHEQIFLLSKSRLYYYDADSVMEPRAPTSASQYGYSSGGTETNSLHNQHNETGFGTRTTEIGEREKPEGRNRRTVWTITSKPFKGAHFAVFPPELPETCLLAGSPEDGVVLDPFSGAATTGIVAVKNKRRYIGIELNPEYVELTKRRFEEAVTMANLDALFDVAADVV